LTKYTKGIEAGADRRVQVALAVRDKHEVRLLERSLVQHGQPPAERRVVAGTAGRPHGGEGQELVRRGLPARPAVSRLHGAVEPAAGERAPLAPGRVGERQAHGGGPFEGLALLPGLGFLEKLVARNEHLIASQHPLRNQIVRHLGPTPSTRRASALAHYRNAETLIGITWEAARGYDPQKDPHLRKMVRLLRRIGYAHVQ
jgi:hypothetical protein